MCMEECFFLYDDIVVIKICFVSFMGENECYDLVLLYFDCYYGKIIVFDM